MFITIKQVKKPTNFYYIPQNSLSYIKIDKLISEINNNSTITGEIKITSGKICFHVLGNTKIKIAVILVKKQSL